MKLKFSYEKYLTGLFGDYCATVCEPLGFYRIDKTPKDSVVFIIFVRRSYDIGF